MHIRTATREDSAKIKALYEKVYPGEFSDDFINDFINKSLATGLMVVAQHPNDENLLIGEVHGFKHEQRSKRHVFTGFQVVVSPEFQGKKIGRTLFTIFLEEVGHDRLDIGRVELNVPESNTKALALFQSMGFFIEGRMEMRARTGNGGLEADIAMAWQNPNFEFDHE